MDNKKIGDYISTLRKNKNLTQKDLADQLGITDKAVSKWERGIGYPDISLLRPLADVLGTSVNELLEGEPSMNISNSSSDHIDNALNYADKLYKLNTFHYGRLLSNILSLSLLLAIFISIIVDLAVNQQLSWSLLVTAGCFLGGCLIIPPLLKKKRGIFYSFCLLTILIIPFLAIIELIISGSVTTTGWVWGIGIPVSLVWLVTIWLFLFLYNKSKINFWFYISIILILCIPGQIFTNYVIDLFTAYAMDINSRNISTVSSVLCIFALSGIFFIIGLNKKKNINSVTKDH